MNKEYDKNNKKKNFESAEMNIISSMFPNPSLMSCGGGKCTCTPETCTCPSHKKKNKHKEENKGFQ